MLLAGIVVTIAFVTTALTLSQVSTLERQAATEAASSLASEWRFIRDRLAANLNTSITVELKNDTFNETTLPAIATTFRVAEAEKGFDVVIRRATTTALYGKSEATFVSGPNYNAKPLAGQTLTHTIDADQTDGILWKTSCDDGTAPAIGCIQAVVIFVQISDGVSTLKEILVVRVNTNPWLS